MQVYRRFSGNYFNLKSDCKMLKMEAAALLIFYILNQVSI